MTNRCFNTNDDLQTGECIKDTKDNHQRHEDETGFTWLD